MSGKEAADRRASKAASRNAPTKYRAAQKVPSVGAVVDWSDVDSDLLHRCVASVVAAGDAITFSRTSDGGAYALTVLADGLRHRSWHPTVEECEEKLREIREDAERFNKHQG